MEKTAMITNSAEVDLFADATLFQLQLKQVLRHRNRLIYLLPSLPFLLQPLQLSTYLRPLIQLSNWTPMAPKSEPANASMVDPFATVPLNNFNGSSDIFGSFTYHSDSASKEPEQNPIHDGSSDIFGSFTSHSDSASKEPVRNQVNDGNLNNMNTKPSQESKAPQKKDTFQVKSGIWPDYLSRGIIDLNISAPKKVSLVDVGVLGGLSDVDKREKGPPTSFYMGRAMGTGSGLGKTGFTSSQATAER